MPLPRVRIRSLMMAVAVVAVWLAWIREEPWVLYWAVALVPPVVLTTYGAKREKARGGDWTLGDSVVCFASLAIFWVTSVLSAIFGITYLIGIR